MQRNRRGFTLFELLVVAAIIAILTIIALPRIEEGKIKAAFQNTFGLESSPSHLTEDERLFIQPFIDARLEDLASQYYNLLEAKDSLLLSKSAFVESEPESTLGSINEHLRTIKRLNQEIKDADESFTKAREIAIYFEFEVRQDIDRPDSEEVDQ